MNATSLFSGVIFGSIGMGYFIYGKKQQSFASILCGLGLMVFPYVITDTFNMLLVGTGLIIAPFLIKF